MNKEQANRQLNKHDQEIGPTVPDWQTPSAVQEAPETQVLSGQYCSLSKLEAKHASKLHQVFSKADDSLWTYLPYGPFDNLSGYEDLIDTLNSNWRKTSLAYCIQSADQKDVLGLCAYLRMMPQAGSIEIGHLCFSPTLQKTPAATEAIFLLIDAVFKLGYRRCEWKCNDLNLPSIAAAKRYGFKYEGTFRQAQVVKGHNRDTAWLSIVDHEWQSLKPCFEAWLDPQNFTADGKQIKRLSSLTSALTT
jgi:RimJ/RimL family protein N-acetyltransferase